MHPILEVFRETRGLKASRAAFTISGFEDYQSRFKYLGQCLHEPGFQRKGGSKIIEQLLKGCLCCDIYIYIYTCIYSYVLIMSYLFFYPSIQYRTVCV